jgi:Patatin-like phospholipase
MKGDAREVREDGPVGPGRGSGWRPVSVFLYLIRFPLIAAAALVLIPYLSGDGRALDALVGGAFELTGIGTFYVMLGGFTMAWTILVTIRLVWLYGRFRFVELAVAEVAAARAKAGLIRRWWLVAMDCERWLGHALAALLVAPLLVRVIAANPGVRLDAGFSRWSDVAGCLASTLIAGFLSLALLWLAEIALRRRLAPSESDKTSVRFLLLPPHRKGPLARTEVKADEANAETPPQQNREPGKIFAGFVRLLGPGFRAEGSSKLYAGHTLATSLLLASLVVYAVLGMPQGFGKSGDKAPSSLAYLLSAGVLLTWALSGMSFFFDRLRVPVALPILVWFYLMTLVPSNEHHFPILKRNGGMFRPPTAAEVVGERESIIVVAAGGGGIRAAAWAARVLVGLDELSRKDPDLRRCGIRFTPNVRLLSGVSGGSVAILHFAGEYDSKHGGWLSDPGQVVDLSEHSSLDPLVWGLVYPDFGRALIPFLISPTRNRGGELETEWRDRMEKAHLHPDPGLSTWWPRTAAGETPALIFNSTDAETGERIIIGTTRIGVKPQRGRVMFDELYLSKWDIAPVTAVRMSATFPYITPAAKPSFQPSWRGNTSWVDGGYSDNFGMASVLDWVEEALSAPNSKLRRVMVVQIQAGPDPLAAAKSAEGGRGLYYQLGVPLEAMLRVWNSGQAVRNDTQLAMIQVAWQYNESGKCYAIETVYCALQIPPNPDGSVPTLPLSWHLTAGQKEQLDKAWCGLAKDKNGPWPKIKSFLQGELPE